MAVESDRGRSALVAVLLIGVAVLWAVFRPWGGVPAPADAGLRPNLPAEILIVHRGLCSDAPGALHRCEDETHWRIHVGGRETAHPDDRKDALRRLPDRGSVQIRGDAGTPWGVVQSLLADCAREGRYKIDWRLEEHGHPGPPMKAWLPRGPDEADSERIILEEIRVFMKWFPEVGGTVRKVGNRGMVESDEDLMAIVLQMVSDYGKAGKTDFPILIDASNDVPWRDVAHVVDLCRRENLQRVEFAAPAPPRVR